MKLTNEKEGRRGTLNLRRFTTNCLIRVIVHVYTGNSLDPLELSLTVTLILITLTKNHVFNRKSIKGIIFFV